jgi:hypothetical protein
MEEVRTLDGGVRGRRLEDTGWGVRGRGRGGITLDEGAMGRAGYRGEGTGWGVGGRTGRLKPFVLGKCHL